MCNAYNHEQYIRSALEGFVMQKTTFPYEVLVHDDASTDKTADIIREYQKKYPEIIKPIYETENQYSKGDGSLDRIQYGRVKGKYIALCEGDDYWTDPLKLQKQYDVLESNPDIDICATSAKTERNGKIEGKIAPASENKIFTIEDVIEGGGGFVATASLMHRTSIRSNPPRFLRMMSLDYFIQIAGALHGGMAYLAEPTCVYRLETNGSWTTRMKHNRDKYKQHTEKVERTLVCLDEETSKKYHNVIMKKIQNNKFTDLVSEREYKTVCLPEYTECFKKLPYRKQMIMRLGKCFPRGVNLIWEIWQKVK